MYASELLLSQVKELEGCIPIFFRSWLKGNRDNFTFLITYSVLQNFEVEPRQNNTDFG